MKLCQIFTNIITNAKFAFLCNYFVKFLVFELFQAERIITLNLPTLLLMRINLRQFQNLIAEFTLNSKRVDDFFDDSAGASNSNVLVAAGTVFVHLQPIFNTSFTKQLIAIITFFGFSADFKADLAEDESCEVFADFEAADAVGVITHRAHL